MEKQQQYANINIFIDDNLETKINIKLDAYNLNNIYILKSRALIILKKKFKQSKKKICK